MQTPQQTNPVSKPQKELEPDDEQKALEAHGADESQEQRNGARSLQIKELSIHSQGDKTKSNKTSEFSKTSSVRRILDLELKALREQEDLQARPDELRREAKKLT